METVALVILQNSQKQSFDLEELCRFASDFQGVDLSLF